MSGYKQAVIIFEGPDMTGKTNIALNLSSAIKAPYFKNKNEFTSFEGDKDYFRNVLKYGVPYLLDYIKQTESGAIFDRQYPTEWVYSRAFKRETYPEILKIVDEAFASLGTKIILCSRSDYTNIYDDRFPDRLGPHKLAEIDALYDEFAAWTACKTHRLNVDDGNIEREVYECIKFVCAT